MPAVRAKRNEDNMIHLGDITKITVMKSSRWTASHLEAHAKTCPLPDEEQVLQENGLDCSWKLFGS